jgi:hypothetical protein
MISTNFSIVFILSIILIGTVKFLAANNSEVGSYSATLGRPRLSHRYRDIVGYDRCYFRSVHLIMFDLVVFFDFT